MILDLIKKETDYSVKEEILNLLHARQSTRKSYLLAVDFYNTLDSEALKSDALIAITNLGSCCISELQDQLIYISEYDESAILRSIARSYFNRITQ